MSIKKNQHFLPQYYFKFFSHTKKNINLILRKSGKVISNASIKGQCSKNNFYGSIEVEELFSKIEGEHSRILRDIQAINSESEFSQYIYNYDSVTDSDIAINPDLLTLLQIILFQRNRTEYEAKKLDNTFSGIYKKLLLDELLSKGDEEVLKYKDSFEIISDETAIVLMLIRIAFEYTSYLLDMNTYILSNETNTEFIFSDSPVIFYNKAYRNIEDVGVLGLQSPGLMIFFPISPDKYILLMDDSKYEGAILGNNFFKIKNNFDIDTLNKLQLHHSLNSIYFSENISQGYIRKLWRKQKNNFKNIFGCTKLITVFNVEEQKDMEVLHSYQYQVPFDLNLSFVNPINITNESSIPSYRNKNLI